MFSSFPSIRCLDEGDANDEEDGGGMFRFPGMKAYGSGDVFAGHLNSAVNEDILQMTESMLRRNDLAKMTLELTPREMVRYMYVRVPFGPLLSLSISSLVPRSKAGRNMSNSRCNARSYYMSTHSPHFYILVYSDGVHTHTHIQRNYTTRRLRETRRRSSV